MKTKRSLEIKEKKIQEALAKEEKKQNRAEVKKRYVFFFAFLAFFLVYFIILQLSYNSYIAYDDSAASEKYLQTIKNFDNLSKYHLKYKTSFARDSLPTDIYYIRNNLFLISYEDENRIETSIYIPDRKGITYSKKNGYEGNCIVFHNSSKEEKNFNCIFNTGFSSEPEKIPINLNLNLNQSIPKSGKIFLNEKKISGEKILCFDTKIDTPIFSQTSLYGLGKYFPALIRLLQKAPHEIDVSDHSCFTEYGVLVQTQKYERFISIEYYFNDSFLLDIPLYMDFQKFLNKSFANRSQYYKLSIDTISTYFKDFGNYAVFGSFDGKDYFTSGCLNDTDLTYNKSCGFVFLPPHAWINRTFYPLRYTGAKKIANYSTDCFEYYVTEKGLESKNDFCIMDGGYMVSEYLSTNDGGIKGYENTNISVLSQKEFDRQMLKAKFLAAIKE